MRRHVEVHQRGRDVDEPRTARGDGTSRRQRLELAGRSVLGVLGLTMVLLMLSAVLIAVLLLAFNWLVFGMVLGGLGE
ncbi:hypothetical protein [Humibacillus xanthopallidus]|uniref:Uncharacterized protein n=1 Tax=Humibacillus xanthopallidus TaxID=412689 RepID=A0A543I2N0_9MICO|nr:hypothetical protein [Humibacillus xanthopallidus]TQM64854.1 hypothetical protein FBY41_1236 [Humibacillus xanthopallidus]